jgi:dTDP-4-amino-4,6-dideoxygalactose transaminase
MQRGVHQAGSGGGPDEIYRRKTLIIEKQIPLLDLKAQFAPIRDEIMEAVTRVMDSQRFIMGEEVVQLEKSIAAYSNASFAIGCASGSDALFLALLACGIGPGDEVLTTPYTFFATVGAIVRAGAKAVFTDIDPATFNMDVTQVAAALDSHPRIKAIIPIHLFGACADMDPIVELAIRRGIPVIEDAAQSIGAEYKGRRSGSLATMACFSFFPSKNLGGFGDGGMLTTNDPAIAENLRALRIHGAKKKYYHELVGINSRLDALQAAILRVKFRYLDSWTDGRRRNADRYRELFAGLDLPVTLPAVATSVNRHVYNQFVIRAERRDQLQSYLKEQGIGSEVYYPLSLHQQKCFEDLGYKTGDFPVSEQCAADSLALPIYTELPGEALEYVCQSIRKFYA